MTKGIYQADGRLWADWPEPSSGLNEKRAYDNRPSIPVHPDLQKVWEVGKMYEKGKDYEIKWFVKTSSYQGEGGGLFDTEKEAEKKYMEWSKYNGQLQCLTEKPVMQAVPITVKAGLPVLDKPLIDDEDLKAYNEMEANEKVKAKEDEKDLIIAGLEEGSELWKAEYENCRAILTELVYLKTLKDTKGKTDEYEQRQPLAWIAAKKFLEKYQHH
jgi:hypothetical protein